MIVKFKKLYENAVIPKYQTAGASCMDLVACLDAPKTMFPGEVALIPTGLAMELEPGYEAQIRSRSGMSIKGLVVANSPGTIDSDFRGEIMVIIKNTDRMETIHPGTRIAQMGIFPAPQAEIIEVDELSETARGINGFGSTGK